MKRNTVVVLPKLGLAAVAFVALTRFTSAQIPPLSPTDRENTAQQSGPISTTYGDTVKMLKACRDSPRGDDLALARLFAEGDARASDLQAACRSSDEEIASGASFLLLLLGNSECDCGNSTSRKHKERVSVCTLNLADVDFRRIEDWLAKEPTKNGYECRDDDEPLAPFGDSLVYALILDGSPRSKSILGRMLKIRRACAWNNIVGEPLEQAESLIVGAKKIGHNLKFEPDTLEKVIRASAFFIRPEYRKESRVKVIAENKIGNRMLIEVSYWCDFNCGRGYWVVLRKDGSSWQYALVLMAWIS